MAELRAAGQIVDVGAVAVRVVADVPVLLRVRAKSGSGNLHSPLLSARRPGLLAAIRRRRCVRVIR
jgi:hypothetical protein